MTRIPVWLRCALGLGSLVALFLADLCLGQVTIPLHTTLSALLGQSASGDIATRIVLEYRLPRAITSLLAGASLAVAGLQMQTLFRNPLAGPYELGMSSGASLGVALLVIGGGASAAWSTSFSGLGHWGVVLAAIVGAAGVMGLIVALAMRVSAGVNLLIIGLMIGSITGALVAILQYFTSPELLQSFLLWSFGSVGGLGWNKLAVLGPIVGLGILLSLVWTRSLDALLAGESHARTLGVSVPRARLRVVLTTSLLAGSVTAFCGPIAFVGMAVPHLARPMVEASLHRRLLPACLLCGGVLMLLCDLATHWPGSATTLPLNAVTALFGAPVVIWVVIGRRNLQEAFG